MKGLGLRQVVAVKSVTGAGGLEWWSKDKLLPGDVLEQLRVVSNVVILVNAPFPGGKAGLQSELREIYNVGARVIVKARRGRRQDKEAIIVEVHACVVAEESVMRKKHYSLADANDKSHIIVLMDGSEEECISLQNETRKVLEEVRRSRVANAQLKDCLVPYTWQQKMQSFLPCPNSGMIFSLLLMPFQPNRAFPEFYDMEETSARAMAWLSSAQTSGVPITFVNIQIEPILLQGSGSSYFGSSSKEDLPSVVNVGKYTIQDWQGTDIHIVRAIRLWFAPAAAELSVNLKPTVGETRLGVGISRTEEGFCYVSSVDHGTAADRAGLKKFYEGACSAQKLLVISRVAGEKVTPWMVNSSGSIRCFDTISISEKLSAHRQAQQPIQFHLMIWDGAFDGQGWKLEVNASSRTGVTDEPAPVGSRDGRSNPTSRNSSPRKLDRHQHHASISSSSPKQSEWHYQSDGNSSPTRSNVYHSPDGSTSSRLSNQDHQTDANGNINHSFSFNRSQPQKIESMPWGLTPKQSREGNNHCRVHPRDISSEDGVDDAVIKEQSESRESRLASALKRAVSDNELAVDEIQPVKENMDFSFSF
ncbi:hypothetical protein O6H91_22G021600 [Diphasiastrum complanatum]|uniref:Uncharacterized protein n=1 Tax=Diphasiastrum complanatum TaxID=34168 RepID=A0ACC2ADI7_DIPCM|nr:hypothetical protein O6H91_22G021600 [Diphasiastrum complanatum]